MSSESKSAPEPDANTPDFQAIMNDIAALKRDLAVLIRNMKVTVAADVASDVGYVRTAVDHFGDEAAHVYQNLAAQGGRSVKAIGHKVEEQPVISLLIAFAIGFVGSRLLMHRDS